MSMSAPVPSLLRSPTSRPSYDVANGRVARELQVASALPIRRESAHFRSLRGSGKSALLKVTWIDAVPRDRIAFPQSRTHPDVVFMHDNMPTTLVDWLRTYFLNAVEAGERFSSGETIQLGWMLVALRQDAEGSLALWEPDFRSIPIVWTEGIDTTLRHLSLQRAVCAALNASPVFPSIRDSAVVSTGFIENGNTFVMTRDEPVGNDSGWLFRKQLDVVAGASRRSVFEIALRQYDVVPFVALPPGARVSRTEHEIEIELGTVRASSKTNEFLAKLASNRPAD